MHRQPVAQRRLGAARQRAARDRCGRPARAARAPRASRRAAARRRRGKLPARLRAQRSPAAAVSTGRLCAWMPRTLPSMPRGLSISRSPTATAPAATVPVDDQPDAGQGEGAVDRQAEQARRAAVAARAAAAARRALLQMRGERRDAVAGAARHREDRALGIAGGGEQVADLARHRGRAARRSTRSILVTTPVISATPISSRMSRCSRVCGRGPSSAATTSSTRSIDSTPASMFGRNRSWPGTSTKPSSVPSGKRRVGKAEIDRQPAPLLLGQAVGVDPGQRPHQRGLAVVDMAGGGEDHVAAAEQIGELGEEAGLVFEAAQVEHHRARFDTADDRDRQARARRAPDASTAAPDGRAGGAAPAPALGNSDTGSAPLPIWLLVATKASLGDAGEAPARPPATAAGPAPRSRRAGAPAAAAPAAARPADRDRRRAATPLRARRGGSCRGATRASAGSRQPRDQIGAADDEPRLRAAQQFVAAEGDEIGARAPAPRRRSARAAGPNASRSTSVPLPRSSTNGIAVLARQRGELRRRHRGGEALDRVIAGVHLEDQPGLRPDRGGEIARDGCGWWCRPRAAACRRAP